MRWFTMDVQEKCAGLEMENMALKFKKYEVRGCNKRQLPSDY